MGPLNGRFALTQDIALVLFLFLCVCFIIIPSTKRKWLWKQRRILIVVFISLVMFGTKAINDGRRIQVNFNGREPDWYLRTLLYVNRLKWTLRGQDDYVFRLESGPHYSIGGQIATVFVEDAEIADLFVGYHGLLEEEHYSRIRYWEELGTVSNQFDMIEGLISGEAAVYETTYHPRYGFPLRVKVDLHPGRTDSNLTFEINDMVFIDR